MKYNLLKLLLLFIASMMLLTSCKRKKLEEVVEVPLPAKEEKLIIGQPDDVKATDGAFSLTKLPFQYKLIL